MYDDLVKRIKKLLDRQRVIVIAICGHGGAGKPTLADKLASELGITKQQIVRVDGLHAKNYMQAKDIFEHHDWEVLLDLMSHAHTSKRLKYLQRNDKEIERIVDVPRPNVVIFEGIRLIRPEILPYVDISVWIDCPLGIATKRAKERNRKQGDSEAEIALWDTKWVPEARQYVARIHPEKIADFIYTQSAS